MKIGASKHLKFYHCLKNPNLTNARRFPKQSTRKENTKYTMQNVSPLDLRFTIRRTQRLGWFEKAEKGRTINAESRKIKEGASILGEATGPRSFVPLTVKSLMTFC